MTPKPPPSVKLANCRKLRNHVWLYETNVGRFIYLEPEVRPDYPVAYVAGNDAYLGWYAERFFPFAVAHVARVTMTAKFGEGSHEFMVWVAKSLYEAAMGCELLPNHDLIGGGKSLPYWYGPNTTGSTIRYQCLPGGHYVRVHYIDMKSGKLTASGLVTREQWDREGSWRLKLSHLQLRPV